MSWVSIQEGGECLLSPGSEDLTRRRHESSRISWFLELVRRYIHRRDPVDVLDVERDEMRRKQMPASTGWALIIKCVNSSQQVHLNVSCDASLLPPKVTSTLERFITAYSSPVALSSHLSAQTFQVDWVKLEPVFDSLAEELERESRRDLTIFVLNPRRNAKMPRYGELANL